MRRMFFWRRCDWISISRRSWCSTPAFSSWRFLMAYTHHATHTVSTTRTSMPPLIVAYLDRHDELALALAGQIHVAELSATERLADLEVAQRPPLRRPAVPNNGQHFAPHLRVNNTRELTQKTECVPLRLISVDSPPVGSLFVTPNSAGQCGARYRPRSTIHAAHLDPRSPAQRHAPELSTSTFVASKHPQLP